MDNLIQKSLSNIAKTVSERFGQAANTFLNTKFMPNQKMTVNQAVGKATQNFSTDFGNVLRGTGGITGQQLKNPIIPKVPIISNLAQMSANTGQTVASGMQDIGTGGYKVGTGLQQGNALKVGQGLLNVGFGTAKIATINPANQFGKVFQGANILSNINSGDFTQRLSKGIIQGQTNIQGLSPTVKEKKVNLLGMEFDPVVTGGSMIGFTQNPLWNKIFGGTAGFNALKLTSAPVANFVATRLLKGGTEGFIQTLNEIPLNADSKTIAIELLKGIGFGAGSELGMDSLNVASKKLFSKLDDQVQFKKAFEKVVGKIKYLNEEVKYTGAVPRKRWQDITGLYDKNEYLDEYTGKIMKRADSSIELPIEPSTPQGGVPQMMTPVVTGKARLKVKMKPVEGVPEMQAPKMNIEPPGRPYPWSVWNEKLNKWIDPTVPEEVIYGKTEMPSIDKVNVAEANTLLGNNGQGGLKGLDNTTKTAFQDWVNARRATSLEGLLKKREFSDLDATGPEAFKVFQEGFTKGKYGDVKKYFDSKHQQILETGMPVNYKQNYLPQLWENDKAQVQSIFGNKLGTKPSFTMESVIKDYQEGIDKGLTPKFKTIGELVGWYEKTANKAIADHSFFKYLGKEGMIMSQGKAPSDWVTLSPDRFPKVKVNIDGQQYSGTYKAPPEMAKLINNYLNTADEGLLAKIAGFTSRAKNIALSFGVPGTGVNAHGINILARHTLFGTGGNPISRFLTGAKYMVNPGAAEAFLNRELSTGPRAVKAGMTLSAEDHNGILNEAETLAKSLGKKWNQAFEIPLFNKMIPALKLSSFNQLVKDGMTEKDAAIMANNVYSGINWEQMGRDRNTQNLLRSILLAPDWAESGVRLGGNIGKSLFTNGKVAARYRTMAATLLGSIVTANVTNKLTSGHYMYENEPGHTFEIEAGYTSDGQKRYLRPYGTAVDFVRLPVDIVIGLSKGDPTPFFRSFSNRMAMPLASALHLITNTDYTGNAIYGRTKYGKEIPPLQAAGGIGSEVMSAVGFPSFAKQAIDTATGKQGLEQGLTKGFELPLRYSGGTFSGNDKKIADTLKVSGKEKYDLSKQLRDQSNFSENQMALIQQNGKEGLNAIIQKRALDNQKEELRKQAEQGGTAQSGNLVAVVTKDGTRVIDTSFQPTKPSLTGQKELDKALTSKYNSEITQKKNDLMLLYKDGKIPLSQVEPQLVELEGMKIKAPTKLKAAPKVKKVAIRKVKTSTAKFKVKMPKLTKIKITKSKKYKMAKLPKLTKIRALAK